VGIVLKGFKLFFRLLGQGRNKDACDIWESILVDSPTDLLAVKFLQDRYLFMGDCKTRMKDAIERVMPHWMHHLPLYGYLVGLHSFTLVETERYCDAERVAREALDRNPRDSWSTHTMAHVMDMTGRLVWTDSLFFCFLKIFISYRECVISTYLRYCLLFMFVDFILCLFVCNICINFLVVKY